MPKPVGWYIVTKSDSGVHKDGPYDAEQIEERIEKGDIDANTLVAHPEWTGKRAVPTRRIARFFDRIANINETNSLIPTARSLETKKNELTPVATKREETGIGRFMADGQDSGMVLKLVQRVQGICTKEECPLYMAIQQRPIANFSPDAVVLTNRRAIVFRQKILGRLEFRDVAWMNVADVHFKENMIGSTISIRGINGHVEMIDYLPKQQARKVYRIAQDMEEKMVEYRRERSMEEQRAGAASVVVNNDLGSLARDSAVKADDDLEKLTKLKQMLDQGLINQSEFDIKKQEILSRM
ncbi:PH domain-containing protein [Mariniblastus sp.]|nr:PH domain-containing protein [Mariniblastus sp.]